MRPPFLWRAAGLSSLLGLCTACPSQQQAPLDPPQPNNPGNHRSVRIAEVGLLTVLVEPTRGHRAGGRVSFTRLDGQVHVEGSFHNLEPFQWHGVHIHEHGNCSAPDAISAGRHYAPAGNRHGLPPSAQRHAGDLGNVYTDANGEAVLELLVDNVQLTQGATAIIGRSFIVHESRDTGEQPDGAAGARIACGVVGVASMEELVSRRRP